MMFLLRVRGGDSRPAHPAKIEENRMLLVKKQLVTTKKTVLRSGFVRLSACLVLWFFRNVLETRL
jgi:hypothetical protein